MIKTDSDLPSNHSEKNSSEAKNYTRMSCVLVHFHTHQAIPEQQSEWCLKVQKPKFTGLAGILWKKCIGSMILSLYVTSPFLMCTRSTFLMHFSHRIA